MLVDELDIHQNYETKSAIVEAMTRMSDTIPFEKLKVTDICKEAGVSRATFYRLFDDKYAPVQWIMRYAYSLGLSQIGRTLSWFDGYYITTAYITGFNKLHQSCSKSDDYNAIDNFAPRQRRNTIIKTYTDRYGKEPDTHLLFDIDCAVTLETTLFPKWHRGEIDADLDTICRWMTQNIPAQLFGLLNQPMESPMRQM